MAFNNLVNLKLLPLILQKLIDLYYLDDMKQNTSEFLILFFICKLFTTIGNNNNNNKKKILVQITQYFCQALRTLFVKKKKKKKKKKSNLNYMCDPLENLIHKLPYYDSLLFKGPKQIADLLKTDRSYMLVSPHFKRINLC